MADKWIKVNCKLSDCLFYNADPRGSADVYCGHNDKQHYRETVPCPLYRMDWQKKAAMAQNLAKMMKR